jgi:hypothetical protein
MSCESEKDSLNQYLWRPGESSQPRDSQTPTGFAWLAAGLRQEANWQQADFVSRQDSDLLAMRASCRVRGLLRPPTANGVKPISSRHAILRTPAPGSFLAFRPRILQT